MPVVDVVPRHPLSHFHTHQDLEFDGVELTSFEMAYWYIYLRQHDRKEIAEQLLKRDDLRWDPTLIAQFVKEHRIVENASLTANRILILDSLMQYQMGQKRSGFKKALLRVVEGAEDPTQLQFVVYSGSERIISCGLRYRDKNKPHTGSNFYGRELRRLVLKHQSGEKWDRDSAKKFLRESTTFLPVKRSVLIIADSQFRHFDTISGRGLVISISGGKYQDMVNAFDNGDFNANDFLYVIVYCGTNCVLSKGYTEMQREEEYRALRNRLEWLTEQRDRPPNTVLFCCAFDHFSVRGNNRHARAITAGLADSPVRCLNWSDFGSPFNSKENGRIKPELFYKDGFHLNHDQGSKVMWNSLCKAMPGIDCFEVTYSAEKQPVPKETFVRKAVAALAIDERGADYNWQPSRKRKIID